MIGGANMALVCSTGRPWGNHEPIRYGMSCVRCGWTPIGRGTSGEVRLILPFADPGERRRTK